MPELSYSQALKELKEHKKYPVMLLHGEEPFFIDTISDYLEHNLLNETFKSFDQTIVYGNEIDVSSLISSAMRFPVGEQQLIIVKEAQNLRDFDGLTSYFERPSPSTVLVLCYKNKSIDKRKKVYKAALSKGMSMQAASLYDNQIPDWIAYYCAEKKTKISGKAAVILSEYLGNDLSKIANEINKIEINLSDNREITVETIEKYIGISRDYNIFELQSAIAKRDITRVFQIGDYFSKNPKATNFSLILLIGTLYSFFSKVYMLHGLPTRNINEIASSLNIKPFFAREYETAAQNFSQARTRKTFQTLLEFDLKMKGVDAYGVNEGELLKEMLYRLLN